MKGNHSHESCEMAPYLKKNNLIIITDKYIIWVTSGVAGISPKRNTLFSEMSKNAAGEWLRNHTLKTTCCTLQFSTLIFFLCRESAYTCIMKI